LQDRVLWNIRVVQSPHLTNYKLTPEEEERIATLWCAAKRYGGHVCTQPPGTSQSASQDS